MQPVISVSNLVKTYASGLHALKGINLDIRRGEIFALLGPNGAGKTTLINVICGIVNPTEGVILADGHDVIRDYRAAHPGIVVLAHPECPPEVVAEADFSGSTAAMSGYVEQQRPPRVVLLTECSMSDNVAVLHPDVEFVRPCNLCPHMKRITLKNIRHALEAGRHEVTIDPAIAVQARRAVERMLAL